MQEYVEYRRKPIHLMTVHEPVWCLDRSGLSRQWIRPHGFWITPRSGYAEEGLVEDLGPQRFYELCRVGVIAYERQEA